MEENRQTGTDEQGIRTKGQLQGRGYRDREKKRGGDRDRNRDEGKGAKTATRTKDSGRDTEGSQLFTASHTPPRVDKS